MLGRILIAGMASLFICIFLGPRFIEFLREREFGQHIREEGPAGHAVKAGTPTMGGIVLFIAVSLPFLILTKFDRASLAVFGTALACALLGFLDDWTKVSKKRSLGLSARKKLLVQAVIAVGLWYVATRGVGLKDELNVRLFHAHLHLGLMAWSETKIILRFWIVAAICSSIGFTLYQQSIK